MLRIIQGSMQGKEKSLSTDRRWCTATGYNAIPILMIPKQSGSLRTVFNKRKQNANTHKLASPLLDMEEILQEVSCHKYQSLIDGKDVYEQIRIVLEHVL